MSIPNQIDILLVDDEPRNLETLEAILDDPGYRLIRASGADQALRALLDNDVAAIVLDIKMPEVSGLELAQMIKNTKRFRETPIVFLTAYMLEDQHVIAGYDAGAVDYLTKPVHPQILRHKVAAFADLFRKTRELAELNETLEERVRERTAELELSEAALREAAHQKDEFLAILAHELRNPLAPLQTGLDTLNMRLVRQAVEPATQRTLASMNRQLRHMVRLIDDLLDISRISRGVLELKKETVELGTVVETTVDAERPLFERRDQRLSLETSPGLHAAADPTRVAQIVTNLLTNAAKFTPTGGEVVVRVFRDGDQAVISVTDSGAGIPQEDVERIFGMFARVQRRGLPSQPGLGVGLALARRLSEMHGGTLSASSSGEGKGSTFSLRLPALSETAAGPTAEDPPGAAAGGALRIVVIEDSDDIAETLMEMLELLGNQVWVARTGPAGLESVRTQRPDVVLCDLGLPDMDGIEVCRRVRELSTEPRPLMVAMTGWGRDEDRKQTQAAGFDHHLVKPVTVANLQRVLSLVTPAKR